MGLCLLLLHGGADDCGQIAYVLRDQEIMLHESFDAGEAAAGRVASCAAIWR